MPQSEVVGKAGLHQKDIEVPTDRPKNAPYFDRYPIEGLKAEGESESEESPF